MTSTSANPKIYFNSLPSAAIASILVLSYGLILTFSIRAISSLMTNIAALVSRMYSIVISFSNNDLCLLPLFGMYSALSVIVLDFCCDFGCVGVTKFPAFCLKNFIIFGCHELIDGGLAGMSGIEYPCGVNCSVLLIMLVLLLRRSSYICAMSIAFASVFGPSILSLALVS